jgi:hypothetical protein
MTQNAEVFNGTFEGDSFPVSRGQTAKNWEQNMILRVSEI